MDVRFINPFLKSVGNTFNTMCGAKVTFGKPGMRTADCERADVSAIIGFSGDAAGSVVLCFSFDCACKIATAFAGTEITPEHPDFADALGELANMVAGGAKAGLDGLNINISLPTVVTGRAHKFPNLKAVPRLLIPCSTALGEFRVDVGLVLDRKTGTTDEVQAIGAEG